MQYVATYNHQYTEYIHVAMSYRNYITVCILDRCKQHRGVSLRIHWHAKRCHINVTTDDPFVRLFVLISLILKRWQFNHIPDSVKLHMCEILVDFESTHSECYIRVFWSLAHTDNWLCCNKHVQHSLLLANMIFLSSSVSLSLYYWYSFLCRQSNASLSLLVLILYHVLTELSKFMFSRHWWSNDHILQFRKTLSHMFHDIDNPMTIYGDSGKLCHTFSLTLMIQWPYMAI